MRYFAAVALALLTAGCGGSDTGLSEDKIERCATALVPYGKAEGSGSKGLSLDETKACDDLNANEKSEAIARMYGRLR